MKNYELLMKFATIYMNYLKDGILLSKKFSSNILVSFPGTPSKHEHVSYFFSEINETGFLWEVRRLEGRSERKKLCEN